MQGNCVRTIITYLITTCELTPDWIEVPFEWRYVGYYHRSSRTNVENWRQEINWLDQLLTAVTLEQLNKWTVFVFYRLTNRLVDQGVCHKNINRSKLSTAFTSSEMSASIRIPKTCNELIRSRDEKQLIKNLCKGHKKQHLLLNELQTVH